jgi:tight adherence protein C
MLWFVTAMTFVMSAVVVIAIVWAFSPSETQVAGRLTRIMDPQVIVEEDKFTDKQKERVGSILANLGKLLPAASGKQASRAQLMLMRAGFRDADSIQVVRGVKLLLPVVLVSLVLITGIYSWSPFFMLMLAIGAGFILPEFWLQMRIRARQHKLRIALPDGLDLLVICVEVGLGLDQAMLRVAQELKIVHPELSEELTLVNLEMRVGKTRIEALRELGRRTGLDDLKTLVAMLIQTERFGTSVAQSLRVHSDELRSKRRQRAEELSAKTTVKMVGPLVFFIFPALLVVILGPAALTLVRQLLPALK